MPQEVTCNSRGYVHVLCWGQVRARVGVKWGFLFQATQTSISSLVMIKKFCAQFILWPNMRETTQACLCLRLPSRSQVVYLRGSATGYTCFKHRNRPVCHMILILISIAESLMLVKWRLQRGDSKHEHARHFGLDQCLSPQSKWFEVINNS